MTCVYNTANARMTFIFSSISSHHLMLTPVVSGWFWRFLQKKQQFSVALPTP